MRALLLATILATASVQPAMAQADEATIIEIIRDRAAAHGQSAEALIRVARCESRLDPNAVGDSGHSVGLFQVHDRGLLSLWRQWGYGSRTDPWEAADFTARAWAAGLRRHWSC